MASLLLAGGAFSNVWAETFKEATANGGHFGKYYIVKVNGGQRDAAKTENKGYAEEIKAWDMLSSVTSAHVAASSVLSENELWSIVVTDAGKYQLVNAATKQTLSVDGLTDFSGDDTALWFDSNTKKGYNGGADADCDYSTASGSSDRVWGYDLQETDYKAASSVVSGAISASQPYLLMGGLVDSEVLVDSNEDGKALFGDYVKDEYKSYWYVVVDKTQKVATFKNKKSGKTLTDKDGKTIYAKLNSNFTFDDNENIELYVVGGPAEAYTSVALGVVESHWFNFTAEDLMNITGAGFQMDIKKHEDGGSKDKELAGNPFIGLLKPVQWKNDNYYTATVEDATASDEYYMLQNEEGDLIVADLNQKYAETEAGIKYALTTISPKTLANALASNDDNVRNRYAYNFAFKSSDAFEIGVDQIVEYIEILNNNGCYKLGSVTLSGTYTLSAEPWNGSPLYLDDLTIKIGRFNTIDVVELLKGDPTFFTVTNVATKKTSPNYGKVLGLNKAGDATYVKTAEALVGYPETQWAITWDEDNTLTFTNRENTSACETYEVSGLYKTNKANVFVNLATNDTIEIKPVTKYAESDGYYRLNADDLRDEQYYVAAASSVFDNVAYLVENHSADHQIGLDTDKEAATVWNITAGIHTDYNNLWEATASRPDTLVVKSVLGYYNANGEYKETVDNKREGTVMLKLLAYKFQNDANSEYLAYDGSSNRYATGKSGDKVGYKENEAQYFALKVVGDEVYNLIPVKNYTGTINEYVWSFAADSYDKVYSGDGATKGILNNTYMYTQTENDLFVIEKKDAPMYRKVAMADTISIFRNDDAQDVLFEKGEFLGTATSTQFTDANPALFVDTAYVNRGNNNRWEYLLAVNAKHWDSKLECNIPGHPKHEADTTTGRFLVNYMDSANVY